METEKRVYYKLTPSQNTLLAGRLATISQREWEESNIISFYYSVPAPVNTEALERAYWEVIRINDALRLRFERHGLGLRQYIGPFTTEKLTVKEFPDGDAAGDYFAGQQCHNPIPWCGERLTWAQIALCPEGGALLIRAHHACLDGFSLTLILRQLHGFYTAFCQGKEPPVYKTGSVVQYFEERQVYNKSEQHKDDQRYFWKLFMHQPHYRLPGRRLAFVGTADTKEVWVKDGVYSGLVALAKETGTSLQLVLQCAVALTVMKLSGDYNFSLGNLLHGRRNFKMKQTVGCMMNTVPIFYNIDRKKELAEFIGEQNKVYLDAMLHGQIPFGEQLIPSYKESVLNGMNFNHCWLLFSAMDHAGAVADEGYGGEALSLPTIPYQMYLAVFDHKSASKGVQLRLSYQVRVFKEHEVQKMLDTFSNIARTMAENPHGLVENIVK